MSSNPSKPAPKKFVHNGKIVDSVPIHIQAQRFARELYTLTTLYLWTLFAIDARQAVQTYPRYSASGAGLSASQDQRRPLGRINNPNN